MSVMAPEAVAAGRALAGGGGESGGGSGVHLAVGILLMWVGCLGLFFAFEGSAFLGNKTMSASAGGWPAALEEAIQSDVTELGTPTNGE